MKSLVKRAQRGDDQAFVELIEENKQAMYKIAVGILKNDFDAADAIQESILTCYEKLRELKKAQYFKTWLLRILINNCNQMLREQKKVVGIEAYYGAEDIKGKKAVFCYFNPSDLGKFYIYLPSDPRAAYLTDLGLEFPESISKLAEESNSFSVEISSENIDILKDVQDEELRSIDEVQIDLNKLSKYYDYKKDDIEKIVIYSHPSVNLLNIDERFEFKTI